MIHLITHSVSQKLRQMADESKKSSSHLFGNKKILETLVLLQTLLMKSNSYHQIISNHTAIVTTHALITQLHTNTPVHTPLTITANKQCYSHCSAHKGTEVPIQVSIHMQLVCRL
jgi:hypothetical protein